MSHDGVNECFERFGQEIRAEIQKKTDAHDVLVHAITGLKSQISLLQKDRETEIERIKIHNDSILQQHTNDMKELHRKIKRQKLEHDDSLSLIAKTSEEIKVKDKEFLLIQSEVVKLRKDIAGKLSNEVLLTDALDDYGIKINLVEVEIESVRARNRQMHDENKKLKEKIGSRMREQEQQKAEMASFRPRMVDMADRMVAEYKKINKQIVKIDEKQKRIIAEKTAIIMQLQSVGGASSSNP